MEMSNPGSLMVAPAPPQQPWNNGKPTVLTWTSIHLLKPLNKSINLTSLCPTSLRRKTCKARESNPRLIGWRLRKVRCTYVPWSGVQRPPTQSIPQDRLPLATYDLLLEKKDPPPKRVKPVLLRVIRTLLFISEKTYDPHIKATADMIVIAFYFLLCLGEYNAPPSDTQPFDFRSV